MKQHHWKATPTAVRWFQRIIECAHWKRHRWHSPPPKRKRHQPVTRYRDAAWKDTP